MVPYFTSEYGNVYKGDCLEVLRELPNGIVNCCVTSPPYWGLRDYGVDGQLGLEPTPDEYVNRMVEIFREVRRVLLDDGTLWLNLGDSYGRNPAKGQHKPGDSGKQAYIYDIGGGRASAGGLGNGIKEKDLVGIPWMVAFAIRSDGWYLRQDIIWHKKNCMPESVKDRCTKSHEYIFLLSKSKQYFYDHEAIREPYAEASIAMAQRNSFPNEDRAAAFPGQPSFRVRGQGTIKLYGAPSHKGSSFNKGKTAKHQQERTSDGERFDNLLGRNKRSVWEVSTKPFSGAHFATFPKALIEPCILAGCPEGGTVLDPFFGSGTTGVVSYRNGRNFVGIELSEAYLKDIAIPRIRKAASQRRLFAV